MPDSSDTNYSFTVPSHHPVALDEDALDYRAYADAIYDVLDNAEGKNTGLTIGVFGDWGTGKSSILRMLKERLDKRKGREDQFLTVEFNAWQYLHQEELWLALLRRILRVVERDGGLHLLLKINCALWRERVKSNPTFWKSLKWILATFIFIAFVLVAVLYALYKIDSLPGRITVVLSGGMSAFILNLLLFARRSVVAILQGKINLQIPSLAGPKFDQGEPLRVDDFHRDFETIVKTIGKRKTLVVLIDDLDRCPPNQVVPVLEAIKHFGFDKPLHKKPQHEDRPRPSSIAGRWRILYMTVLSSIFGQKTTIYGVDHAKNLKTPDSSSIAFVAFVIAADRHAIERAVYGHFKDYFSKSEMEKEETIQRFSREYLEKIVQLSFVLPPLSRLKLGILLDREAPKALSPTTDPTSKPFLDEKIYEQARDTLLQGPINRQRAIIDAYRTFLLHWSVVRKRNITDINPKVLASLSLMKYAWPDEFAYMVSYPHYFFYLHALSQGKANNVCQPSETAELLDLGLPAVAENSPLQKYHDVNLGRLLAEIELPKRFDINSLRTHLTLFPEQSPIGILHEHPREALRSGDPVRIRFIERADHKKALQVYKEHILNELWGLFDRAQRDGQINEKDFKINEALIYAVGLIGDVEAVRVFRALLSLSGILSHILQKRIVYALGHLGSRETPVKEAVDLLAEIAGFKDGHVNQSRIEFPQDVKRRAVRLLQYCSPEPEQALQIVLEWYKSMDFNEEMILTALQRIDPSQYADEILLDLCERVQNKPWPVRLGDAFVSLASQHPTEPTGRRAFELLKSYPDGAQAMRWMSELSLQSPDWRQQCWHEMGALQSAAEAWQAGEWARLFEAQNWPEEAALVFIEALSTTARQHPQAVPLLYELYNQNISHRLKDEIARRLLMISSDDSANAESRTQADEYLDRLS